jgi:DNA-binding transcriptional ArsR family regulator
MSRRDSRGSDKPESGDSDLQRITDPRSIRALAHPARLALLEALTREGPLTATKAAELLDDTPGNMSWHLQTLAKYGYIEEAGDGRGRSRPWQVVSVSRDIDTVSSADPEATAAGDALEATFSDRAFRRLREWWSARRSYPIEWQKASFSLDAITFVSPEELEGINEEILAAVRRYRSRVKNKAERPEGSMAVHLVAFAHPLPPTVSAT